MIKLLHVLQIGKFYPPHMGGMETHLRTLCEGLGSSVRVSVVVSNDGSHDHVECAAGVPVTRLGTKLTLASAPLCPGLVSRIRGSDADLIHIHLPNPGAVLAYLASGHRGPLVVSYHSDTVRQRFLQTLFEPFLQRFLGRSSAILVTSEDYLRTSPVLRDHKDRCHIVPLGIRLEQFSRCQPSRANKIREEFGDRIVLAVGRMVYYKGFEYLIRAMTQVDGKLLLIGDGPLRAHLESLTESMGLSNRVSFLGLVPSADFTPYYHASDVFVLPSVARTEAFGIVQIEAMAAGKPVVNTHLESGVPFVSLHGVTGLTVRPTDPAALATAINCLLENEALRRTYGAAGRARARELFSVETMTARTLEIYRGIIGYRKPQAVATVQSVRHAATGG